MKKFFPLLVVLALSTISISLQGQATINTLTKKETKEGWKLLFDGKSPDQWRAVHKDKFPSSGWKVENGEMISGKGGDIVTKAQYENFEFTWEWKMDDIGGNSGVKYLVKEKQNTALGIEYQILDDENHEWMKEGKMKPGDYHTMGAVYELYPVEVDKKVNPVGEWNQGKIVIRGSHVEHWLNGIKLVEYERDSEDFKARVAKSKFKEVDGFGLHSEGHLLLQDHGSVVHFRNLKIRPL